MDVTQDDQLLRPQLHPVFSTLKEEMWNKFLQKDLEGAARLAARILQESGAHDAIHVAGLALTGLKRYDEGFDWCCASLSLAKPSAEWYMNAAIAFMHEKDYVHAMVFIENGLKDYPDDKRMNYTRGLCMCHAQNWTAGITFLDDTLRIDPEFYHAKMSKGFCMHMLGRYDEAIALYDEIVDVAEPHDREEIVNNKACVLLDMGLQDEALNLLDTACAGSTRPGTQYNRSFLLLGKGVWPEAWDLYRNRSVVQVDGDQGLPIVDQITAKTLDDVRDKHLFLFHEQGLGDSLMFLRYAKMLRPLVSELTIGVPKSLDRLAKTMDLGGYYTVVSDGKENAAHLAKCDVALPMLDCPAVFRSTVDNVPNEVPYFHVPDKKLELFSDDRLRVGLCWAGASRPENIRAHAIDKRRSVGFELMAPILAMSDRFNFVSLQMEDHHIDDQRLYQPIKNDWDCLDTCTLIKQLDLVITIDSSVVHMAASIGAPTWMLSRHDQCWRWLWDGRTDSIWYPSLRIYQQPGRDTWPEVIEWVAGDLLLWSRSGL